MVLLLKILPINIESRQGARVKLWISRGLRHASAAGIKGGHIIGWAIHKGRRKAGPVVTSTVLGRGRMDGRSRAFADRGEKPSKKVVLVVTHG